MVLSSLCFETKVRGGFECLSHLIREPQPHYARTSATDSSASANTLRQVELLGRGLTVEYQITIEVKYHLKTC